MAQLSIRNYSAYVLVWHIIVAIDESIEGFLSDTLYYILPAHYIEG